MVLRLAPETHFEPRVMRSARLHGGGFDGRSCGPYVPRLSGGRRRCIALESCGASPDRSTSERPSPVATPAGIARGSVVFMRRDKKASQCTPHGQRKSAVMPGAGVRGARAYGTCCDSAVSWAHRADNGQRGSHASEAGRSGAQTCAERREQSGKSVYGRHNATA